MATLFHPEDKFLKLNKFDFLGRTGQIPLEFLYPQVIQLLLSVEIKFPISYQ